MYAYVIDLDWIFSKLVEFRIIEIYVWVQRDVITKIRQWMHWMNNRLAIVYDSKYKGFQKIFYKMETLRKLSLDLEIYEKLP